MVCLVPADPIQRELHRFKQLFDLDQRGFDADRMAADEELEIRKTHAKMILGLFKIIYNRHMGTFQNLFSTK